MHETGGDGARRGWTGVAFGLGGNVGDTVAILAAALAQLAGHPLIRIAARSSVYRTAPWGPVVQPDFANACAIGQTALSPQALLDEVKRIERHLGRETSERWGPRAIDIDILMYGDRTVTTPDLVIPHQSLFQRAFVLVPLAEIAPDLKIHDRRVDAACAALDCSDVRLWGQNPAAAAEKLQQ